MPKIHDYLQYLQIPLCAINNSNADSELIKLFFRKFRNFLDPGLQVRKSRISRVTTNFWKNVVILTISRKSTIFQSPLESVDGGWHRRYNKFETFNRPRQIDFSQCDFFDLDHENQQNTKTFLVIFEKNHRGSPWKFGRLTKKNSGIHFSPKISISFDTTYDSKLRFFFMHSIPTWHFKITDFTMTFRSILYLRKFYFWKTRPCINTQFCCFLATNHCLFYTTYTYTCVWIPVTYATHKKTCLMIFLSCFNFKSNFRWRIFPEREFRVSAHNQNSTKKLFSRFHSIYKHHIWMDVVFIKADFLVWKQKHTQIPDSIRSGVKGTGDFWRKMDPSVWNFWRSSIVTIKAHLAVFYKFKVQNHTSPSR